MIGVVDGARADVVGQGERGVDCLTEGRHVDEPATRQFDVLDRCVVRLLDGQGVDVDVVVGARVAALRVPTHASFSTGLLAAVAAVVVLMMWTVKMLAPWDVLPLTVTPSAPPHVSVPARMAQPEPGPSQPRPTPDGAMAQSSPATVGSRSVSLTPVALPSPRLKTMILKPIG